MMRKAQIIQPTLFKPSDISIGVLKLDSKENRGHLTQSDIDSIYISVRVIKPERNQGERR
jgi:hypothetical protein